MNSRIHEAFKNLQEAMMKQEQFRPNIARLNQMTRVEEMLATITRKYNIAAFQEKHEVGPEEEWDETTRTLFHLEYPLSNKGTTK